MFFSTAFAEDPATKMAATDSVWHAILSASLVVQLTLLLLVAMSIVCWAIIFSKRRQLAQVQNANAPFQDAFWKAGSFDELFGKLSHFENSPMAEVFKAGYLELRKMADSSLADKSGSPQSAPVLSGIDNLQRSLQKAMDTEISKLESRLSYLATTGSTGPFIGLFGTVWGIMGAFQKIGATNVASLAVVAPHISEALVATAIGLLAAIPATVSYNHYVTKIRKEELELSNFAADFLNITKRNFFKDK